MTFGQALGTIEGVRVGQRLGIGSYAKPAPADILGSGYFMDAAADDPDISLSSGKVTSLPNRGLSATAFTQGTGAKQPAWSATSFNGGPGITFSNHYLQCNVTTGIAIGARFAFWLVWKSTATTPTGYMFYVSNAGFVATATAFRLTTTGPHWIADFGGQESITASQAPDTAIHLVECGQFSTLDKLTIDGVVTNGTLTTANGVLLKEFTIGGCQNISPGAMIFARVIVASGEPTASQRAAMKWYLHTKYYGVP